MREKWAIFDLDNTITDINDRLDAATNTQTGKLNYGLLHRNDLIEKYDKPIKTTIDLINNLAKFNTRILILTARADSTRKTTIDWLTRNKVVYDSLIMKSDKDTYMKSFTWKEKKMKKFMDLHNISFEQIVLSCDDYGKNQLMFESWGIPCLDPNNLYETTKK